MIRSTAGRSFSWRIAFHSRRGGGHDRWSRSHRVMFRRDLQGRGPQAVTLAPGATVPVGFAVWNGSAGDRDGKKSVTIWQEIVLE